METGVYKLPNVWGILCRASFEIFGNNIQDRGAFRQTLRTDWPSAENHTEETYPYSTQCETKKHPLKVFLKK